MVYSKIRGAKKAKKKVEVVNNSAFDEKDVFQEEGQKLIERVVAHPYSVVGTVVVVLAIVFGSIFISKQMNQSKGAKSEILAKSVEIWDAEVGTNKAYSTEADKMNAALKSFAQTAKKLEGSFLGTVAEIYEAKAHYRLKEYGKAIELYNKIIKENRLPEDLKFLAYEGKAFCYLDRQDYKNAVKTWKEYNDSTSKSIYKDYALYYMGYSYEQSGDLKKSLDYYKLLAKQYPQSQLTFKIKQKIAQETKSEGKKS